MSKEVRTASLLRGGCDLLETLSSNVCQLPSLEKRIIAPYDQRTHIVRLPSEKKLDARTVAGPRASICFRFIPHSGVAKARRSISFTGQSYLKQG